MKTMKNFILSLVTMLVVTTGFSQVEYKIGVDGDINTVYYNNHNTIDVDVSESIIFISGSFDVITAEAMFQFNSTAADSSYNGEQLVGYIYDIPGVNSYVFNPNEPDTLTFSGVGEIKVWHSSPAMFFVINVTDATQEEEESGTTTIFENEIQVTALNAYPNPVVDYLNVEFETELSEVEISVMNGAGQTIFIDNEMRWNGSNKIVVPMSDQPKGVYIIKVGEVTRKVVRL